MNFLPVQSADVYLASKPRTTRKVTGEIALLGVNDTKEGDWSELSPKGIDSPGPFRSLLLKGTDSYACLPNC